MMGNLNFGVKKKKQTNKKGNENNYRKFQKIPNVKYEDIVVQGDFLRIAFQFDNFGATEVKHKLI